MADRKRDLALFSLAIDTKLRGCDVVAVRVEDVAPSGYAMDHATIRQKKSGRSVRFELTDQTQLAVGEHLRLSGRKSGQLLFAGRGNGSRGLTTRQYARLVLEWVASIGLDPASHGTHSLRRTKAVLIHRQTGNLRAVQLLLGTATYYPRTPCRTSRHLSVPSSLRRGRDGEAAPRTWWCPVRRRAPARWLVRLPAGVDDRSAGFAIRD
jgi:integrase